MMCGDNYYSKRDNNLKDWPDGCTILVPPSNDLLILMILKINVGPDHYCKTCIILLHNTQDIIT